MINFTMKTSLVRVLLVLFLADGALCRPLTNSSPGLLSDGVEEENRFSSYNTIGFKGITNSGSSREETCEQMYGFLPCSNTVPGHLFLILVYEYLLFHAESYVASGGERIFKILGPGVFGASAFQVIGSLPEALILLASGLSSSEIAQECVLTGVGLLAGSSILLLTIIWGTCIILGSQSFSSHLHSNLSDNKKYNPLERLLFSLWPGWSAQLLLHNTCQSFLFFQPWIQRRRLLYIKHEHLVVDILKHLQNETMGKLLTDNGSPNVSTIRRLFEEKDHDGDKVISFYELKEFLQEIKFRNLQSKDDNTTAEIMKEFDIDNDEKITMDEFVNGMTKWLDDTKDAMNKRYHSVKSLKDMYQVLKPWIQKKREEREMMKHLIPDILEHLQDSVYGSLLADDGTPDVPAIKSFWFNYEFVFCACLNMVIDRAAGADDDIKFGIIPYDADVAATKIMEDLDKSGDQLIDEEEFVTGLSRWLNTAQNQSPDSDESEDNDYQKTWEQTDKLVEDKFIDKSPLAWTKAITLLVLGIITLGVLAEPLIQSVHDFSKAARIPSFYVAFIFVPLATTARLSVSAINEARRKKLHTTSLTLSEIYGTVFMNNILGLAVLLSLIYFRGLSWNFTAEVLMVLLNAALPLKTSQLMSARIQFPLSSTMKPLCLPNTLLLSLIILLVSPIPVISRPLISDGNEFPSNSSVDTIRLKGIVDSAGTGGKFESESESCEQMYGFLPCSESVWGHVFLIVVYEYLLFHGESYVASGGERIFKILGPGVFGACAFQLIGSLPESLILLASGLLNSKEVAQECVLTGVGLLAGSSILLLTLLWGTCVILGTQDFSDYLQSDAASSSDCPKQKNPLERLFLSLWPGYGLVTDSWTGYTARIMLVSVIPFTIIQFPRLFRLSLSWERVFVVIALLVSVIFLLSYFFYQLFQPWIQKRQLLYLKHGHLVVDILKHVQYQTMGSLFTGDGGPNLSVIKRIFEETDQDGDKYLTAAELKDFLREIKFRKLYSDKDKVTADMMKEFDANKDKKITFDEFVKGMEKWIEETKKDSGKTYHLNEASIHGSLLTENGTPDLPAIKRLFKDIDHDKDDFISHSELKDLMMDIKFGIIPNDIDAAASKMMEELDVSGDQLINEEEFVTGLSKWLKSSYVNQTTTPEINKDSGFQEKWEQTDELVEDKLIDKSVLAWTKAIALVVLGIVMLGLLAEPLIHSVQNLSEAANIPSFFIAFIFVPLATNARIAISAISEVRRKKLNINSLTFSEVFFSYLLLEHKEKLIGANMSFQTMQIYGTVLMNNLLGFSVLLSLIYFRGLSWDFSVEVLMVLIVSAVVGFLASFSTIFPVWTSFLAYLLYPMSLVLVNVLGDFKWSS
ncbi:UNVERIFIED_CONTAM: Sodium/calcium exchanger NCL1 [Sesamum calycinum]|uniref:Sodium/calcium exchanger NCL1 n=1 Tax=Sesamum calycinum TaxID=2727403 RepID=A0AAW2Q454_9LAMI